ncbi:MAG: hypothetical protein K1X28_06450 [Parachlamydiales bacterium]|nr:hypothetical protein [Parachlamydiales bacterium]
MGSVMGSGLNRTIRKPAVLLPLLLLFACSRMEQSEREKVRRLNCKGEPIYRGHNEVFYPLPQMQATPRPLYPWESETNLPRITKDFFRCKGNPFNPPFVDTSDPEHPTPISDCTKHGLPVLRGKETVYPVLIDLLNFVQKKTGKRVIITCGHRCPVHNTYADPSKENRVSKHQIGAEVDFYVQGMEERPQEIVGILMQYFQESPLYKKDKEAGEFRRLRTTELTTEPWVNKEIMIKLYQKQEGRDGDNRHPHPYISIQVQYDRDGKERVNYNWAKAHQGYPKS